MTHDPLDLVTRALRGAVADPGDVEALPPRRDEAIAKLERALEERALRQRWKRRGFVAAAAAALVLGTAGFLSSQTSSPTSAHAPGSEKPSELGRVITSREGALAAVVGGRSVPLGAGERVSEGSELRTPSGSEAQVDYDTGTRVTLGGDTRVRLIEQRTSKRFAVESGNLTARVAKLGAGERFVVATPDAEVEVRGTAFRVSVVTPDPACAGGTPTRLEVSEGVVVLRHHGVETRIAAGEHWPDCPPAAAPLPPPAPIPPAAPPPRAASSPSRSTDAPASPPVRPPAAPAESKLAEQNDLFDGAMRDKRAGRTTDALVALDRLLAKYPRGPLAESAAVERFRLLRGSARVDAARDYLTRWPQGFARAEAQAIAGP